MPRANAGVLFVAAGKNAEGKSDRLDA